jgi:molybdenum cofactor guanylyltransferase
VDVEVDRAHRRDDIGVAYPGTLLLLAGGESRRMGSPKPLLQVAETTLIEWLAGRLRPAFEDFLVAAGRPDQLPTGLRDRFVPDRRPGAGPLAGIEAGLGASQQATVVAVACDMPYVTAELALRIATACEGHDAAVPRVAGRPEPTCAAYGRGALKAISAALERGDLRASDVLAGLDVNWLHDVERGQLYNLNTPAEFGAFLAGIPKTR